MESQASASESQHSYSGQNWSSATTPTPASHAAPATDGAQETPPAHTVPFPNHLEFLPLWLPQQSNIYHAQLLHYNKLISPARGGGLQLPPLPPVVSSPPVQAAPRSRTSSRASQKDNTAGKSGSSGGHGSRSNQHSEKNRSVKTPKDAPAKMPPRQGAESSKNWPQRSAAGLSTSPQGQSHSSSVPSTPHQHARQFSFGSREPSPNAATNHSPRSAYSETNSTLPSLRPLPPRLGGCKYETAQINSRRRIPYSVGSDRLEKLDLRTVKGQLSEKEEETLSKDMRAIYEKLLPTDKVEKKRKALVDKLEKIFNEEWPGHDIKVHLFGSSGNLLCSDDSDVDICITTPWRELEGVCIIADLLARRGMEKVVCISAAKVPIVKIWDPELGLACDMNVNNTLALENTRMVRTYVDADPRVRQLAMIIKYWTRKRIVNDAAFGGTLSSYTWICLIIAFLQLRNPPVLPALHQMPYKLPKSDGTASDFADDMKRIKGFGNKNKSSKAELLFQFFRFYAHEFDYDKHVLSVRFGKLVTKIEKKWNYAINNQLCVEEPFNTSRNLGNTADEYSFRGLHMELRRAFDLISQGKLQEACEQFVFPPEEERVWSRPAPQPRPVLVRSSSQTHSGRGGRGNHRGGRHNNNFHRGGGSNRRASSGVPAYENMFIAPVNMAQDMSWYHNPQFQFQYAQQDLMTQMAYHQESMRQLHLFAQSPAFMQQQNANHQRHSGSSSTGQPSSDRSRTNSFDNPPVSAPMRPDLYAMYNMGLGHPFYAQTVAGYGTHPSSPVTTSGSTQEFRRSLQRSSAASDAGAPTSSSSLRSQSQPASRSQPAGNIPQSYTVGSQPTQCAPFFAPRSVNGVAIPSFMSDDADFDETPKATNESPISDESLGAGFFKTRSASPTKQLNPNPQAAGSGIAFGDIRSSSVGRRRLSTEQLPQTILDRRMRRASRSPSPLGHARAASIGTTSAPLPSAPFAGRKSQDSSAPLVVNGSGSKAAVAANTPYGASSDAASSLAAGFDNALHIQAPVQVPNQVPVATSIPFKAEQQASDPVDGLPRLQTAVPQAQPDEYSPVVANGSYKPTGFATTEDPSFRDRIAMMNSYQQAPISGLHEAQYANTSAAAAAKLSPTGRPRPSGRNAQGGMIAPLDLAIADARMGKGLMPDMAHLSPVYETRTPSPTTFRKADATGAGQAKASAKPGAAGGGKGGGSQKNTGVQDCQKTAKGQKTTTTVPRPQATNTPRENGHTRGAKSESDGGWQKAGKGKKKAASTLGGPNHGEKPPNAEAERKGG